MAHFKVGEKVRYIPKHGPIEKGIVKSLPFHTNSSVFVVYNCGGDWENYKNYTAAMTSKTDLVEGWGE